VIGMVGQLPDAARAAGMGFAREGDAIALIGPFAPSLAASELAKLRGEPLPDGLPELDLQELIAALEAVRRAVRCGTALSAHDIAEGGLAVALAESCLAGGLGARVSLGGVFARTAAEAVLFGEGSGGFLLSGPEADLQALGERTAVKLIGSVGGQSLSIRLEDGQGLELPLGELQAAHGGGLEEYFA
jgi:phosphoribosylformylglycinamidine (FGAM) synthase-like enzyme